MVEKAFEIKTVDDVCQTVVPPAKIPKTEYLLSGDYNIIDQSQQYIGGYTNDEATLFPNDDYILFGDHTCALKYYEGRFAQGADGLKALTVRDRDLYNPAYIYYAMSTVDIPTSYDRHWSQMASAEIPISPLPEQQRIASILSNLDDLIEKQAKLIDKKQRFRDGMRWDLLTGKKRVNETTSEYVIVPEWGYVPADWKIETAGKHIVISNGGDPHTPGHIPVYGSGGTFRTCGEYKNGPAVLVGRKGTLDNPQYVSGKYWNVDTAYDVKTKSTLNTKFYYYLALFFPYDKISTKTALPSMTQDGYNDLIIPIPPIDEQEAIVEILDDLDNEIRQIEQELQKAQQLKAALLRQLITGEIRVA